MLTLLIYSAYRYALYDQKRNPLSRGARQNLYAMSVLSSESAKLLPQPLERIGVMKGLGSGLAIVNSLTERLLQFSPRLTERLRSLLILLKIGQSFPNGCSISMS